MKLGRLRIFFQRKKKKKIKDGNVLYFKEYKKHLKEKKFGSATR